MKMGRETLGAVILTHKRADLVVTSNEVYHKRTPVIQKKLAVYDVELAAPAVLGDNHKAIIEQCLSMIEDHCNLIICTGDMSGDPGDKTPLTIKKYRSAGCILWSAGFARGMLMLAYYNKKDQKIPIIGLPTCVMYSKQTLFDLILPRIMARDKITKSSLAALGEGDLLL